jgi:tyrosine-protein phosphatase YwqE
MESKEIKERINYFLEKKIPVHISYGEKKWDNGVLVEWESENVLILNEQKYGLIHVFFSSIVDIEELRRKE